MAFDQAKPLDGTDDTDNWFSSAVKFDGIWQAYRWLPKEQLQVEWYKDSVRYSYLDTTTKVHIYQSKDTITYSLTAGTTLRLLEASNLVTPAIALLLGLFNLF